MVCGWIEGVVVCIEIVCEVIVEFGCVKWVKVWFVDGLEFV